MKVLFATTNPAKIKTFATELEKKKIEVVTLKDIGIKLNIEEIGKNAIENAFIKAKSYYEATGIPTIAMDNSLYIEGIPEEKQPGTYVRRVGGKELTDDEMIEYYTNLVKEYGGRLSAKWIFGVVIYNATGKREYSFDEKDFYFVDKPCTNRIDGFPLDSISVDPETNKYWLEMTLEEKKNEKNTYDGVIEFIANNL